jgi:hypothetical protein
MRFIQALAFLLTLLSIAAFCAEPEPSLDSLLQGVTKKEQEERDRERDRQDQEARRRAAIEALERQQREAQQNARQQAQAAFEADLAKFNRISDSPSATAADRQAAWALLCQKWFPCFDDYGPVALEWWNDGAYPATLTDLVTLLARIPYPRDNDSGRAIRVQLDRLLRRTGYKIENNCYFYISAYRVDHDYMGDCIWLIFGGDPRNSDAIQLAYNTAFRALDPRFESRVLAKNESGGRDGAFVTYEKREINWRDPHAAVKSIIIEHGYNHGTMYAVITLRY